MTDPPHKAITTWIPQGEFCRDLLSKLIALNKGCKSDKNLADSDTSPLAEMHDFNHNFRIWDVSYHEV